MRKVTLTGARVKALEPRKVPGARSRPPVRPRRLSAAGRKYGLRRCPVGGNGEFFP